MRPGLILHSPFPRDASSPYREVICLYKNFLSRILKTAGNPLALPVLSLENRSGSFRTTQWLKACGGRNAFAPGDLLGLRQYFLI